MCGRDVAGSPPERGSLSQLPCYVRVRAFRHAPTSSSSVLKEPCPKARLPSSPIRDVLVAAVIGRSEVVKDMLSN